MDPRVYTSFSFGWKINLARFSLPRPIVWTIRLANIVWVDPAGDGVVKLWWNPPGGRSLCVCASRAGVDTSHPLNFFLTCHGESINTSGGVLVLSGNTHCCMLCSSDTATTADEPSSQCGGRVAGGHVSTEDISTPRYNAADDAATILAAQAFSS